MAEPSQYIFSPKEVAESLIKRQGLHEGLWSLYFEFGLGAGNLNMPGSSDVVPTALIPVIKMGLIRAKEINNLTADAAIVNPLRTKKTRKTGH